MIPVSHMDEVISQAIEKLPANNCACVADKNKSKTNKRTEAVKNEKQYLLTRDRHLFRRRFRLRGFTYHSSSQSEFGEIYKDVAEGLKYVFQTKNEVYMLSASGTVRWKWQLLIYLVLVMKL